MSGNTQRRKPSQGHVSHERWLVSYADFITLLFAFFVVLYAFAKQDQKKQIEITESIDSAFHALGMFPDASKRPSKGTTADAGPDQSVMPMNIVMGEDVLSPAKVKDDLQHLKKELTQTLSNQVATHSVSIQMGKDGLVISLREAGFFNPGSAIPKPETLPILRQIAQSLGQTQYDLRIEGHTDNIPIHTAQFDSNWELSSARATHIARIFLDIKAIPPERLSAAGYAEFHPVASNETPEGRGQNRRVDLVVMPRTKLDLNLPGLTHPTGAWHKITDDDEPPAQKP
jgi:chemotaxis protein MotB